MQNPNPKQKSKIISRAGVTILGLSIVLSYLLRPTACTAGSPTEQVRATIDRVLTLIRNPNQKSKTQIDAQRAQLVALISPRFDFLEMSKRSLARHWARRTPEEQREFVKVFAVLMGKSYADNIEFHTTPKILYIREREDQNYAQVDTKIVADNGSPLSINYKLHSVDSEWRIYDVVIEDVSMVNNYRSQFDRIIARSSFPDLVRTMKEKQ